MHPILNTRGRLALYLAVWIPIGATLAALFNSGGMPWAAALVFAVPLALAYAFVCLSAWYPCRATPLEGTSLARVITTHVAAACVASFLWLFAAEVWHGFLDGVTQAAADTHGSGVFPPGSWNSHERQVPVFFVLGSLLFLLSVAVHYLIIAFEASRNAEKRALEAAVLSKEAELKTLRAQIQPHFLFNSLNSISALTASDPESARRMCVLLADFLRKSLRLAAKETITLAEELSLTENFLAIERLRFGERLEADQAVDQETRECLVPPLLLQPLVENAVTHGISGLVEGGTVRIEAHRRAAFLEIAVENACDPEARPRNGAGVGILNVKRRLDALYGREARIDIQNSNGRFRVEVRLPAEIQGAPSNAS